MTSHPIVLALALTACQIEGEPSTSTPSLAATIQAAQVRMHERFDAAQRMEQAVAHGDLERAHVAARIVGTLDEPDALARWRPHLDRIIAAARQVEVAPDIIVAARATAALGRECARCHEEAAAKIVFPVEARPSDGSSKLGPQMVAHQWAAARMWEGLLGPSNDRWLDGADALKKAPLAIVAEEPMTVTLKDTGLPEGDKIGDDVAKVRLYANRALAPMTEDARADAFGQLLATCAHCHVAIRDR